MNIYQSALTFSLIYDLLSIVKFNLNTIYVLLKLRSNQRRYFHKKKNNNNNNNNISFDFKTKL